MPSTQTAELPLHAAADARDAGPDPHGQWCDIWWSDRPVLRNVVVPTLTAYLPDPATATGAGVVLCPGGGWHLLAVQQEGVDVAHQLNALGIAAFVLKYRLIATGDDHANAMRTNFADAERRARLLADIQPRVHADGCAAMAMVRRQAADWHVDADRVGIMGYSAGGNVALNVALDHDAASRPAFVAGIYTAGWAERAVPVGIPLFLLCTADDAMAVDNSVRLLGLWRAAGNPVEMHIYSKGGHGFCLRHNNLPVDDWLTRFTQWLVAHGFLQTVSGQL